MLKIEFDSDLVYGDNDKYIKMKIKIYAVSMITNFQSKKMPRKAPCKCLSKIMLDSVIKAKKKYYSQTYYPQLLKECKYEQEKIKMENLIDDDLEKCLSDESDNDFSDGIKSDDESNKYLLKAKKAF